MKEDISESKTEESIFKDSLKNKKKAMGFEFSLKILTNGCWVLVFKILFYFLARVFFVELMYDSSGNKIFY